MKYALVDCILEQIHDIEAADDAAALNDSFGRCQLAWGDVPMCARVTSVRLEMAYRGDRWVIMAAYDGTEQMYVLYRL